LPEEGVEPGLNDNDSAAEPAYLAVMDDTAEPDYLAVIDDTAEPGYYSEINDNGRFSS
jgi:hypothetical protein